MTKCNNRKLVEKVGNKILINNLTSRVVLLLNDFYVVAMTQALYC